MTLYKIDSPFFEIIINDSLFLEPRTKKMGSDFKSAESEPIYSQIVKSAVAVKVKSIPLQNIVQWSGLTICHALSLYYSVIGDNNINRAGWLWLKCLVFGHSIPIIQDHFQIFRQFI